MRWKDSLGGLGKGDRNDDIKDNTIDVEEIMYGKISKEEANKVLEEIIDTMLRILKENMKEHNDIIFKYLKTWELTILQLTGVLRQYEALENLIDISEPKYPEGIADLSDELVLMFMEMVMARNEAKDPLWILLSMLKTIKSLLLWTYNANLVFAKIPVMMFKKLLSKSELTDKDVEEIKKQIYEQYKE